MRVPCVAYENVTLDDSVLLDAELAISCGINMGRVLRYGKVGVVPDYDTHDHLAKRKIVVNVGKILIMGLPNSCKSRQDGSIKLGVVLTVSVKGYTQVRIYGFHAGVNKEQGILQHERAKVCKVHYVVSLQSLCPDGTEH